MTKKRRLKRVVGGAEGITSSTLLGVQRQGRIAYRDGDTRTSKRGSSERNRTKTAERKTPRSAIMSLTLTSSPIQKRREAKNLRGGQVESRTWAHHEFGMAKGAMGKNGPAGD